MELVTKPVEQADVGDIVHKPRWFGLWHEPWKVLEIDDERRYAFVCHEPSDSLNIMNLQHNGSASPGHYINAECSCSYFMRQDKKDDRINAAWHGLEYMF